MFVYHFLPIKLNQSIIFHVSAVNEGLTNANRMLKRNRLWDFDYVISFVYNTKRFLEHHVGERKDFKLPFYSCTKDGLIMNAAKEVRLERSFRP